MYSKPNGKIKAEYKDRFVEKKEPHRPVVYDDDFCEHVAMCAREYTNGKTLPSINDFLLTYEDEINEIDYDTLYGLRQKHQGLSNAIKRLLRKKERDTEKLLISGKNNTGAIFILKQLGWKDNPEIVVNNNNTVSTKEKIDKKIDGMSEEELEKLDEMFGEEDL